MIIGSFEITNPILLEFLDGLLHDADLETDRLEFDPQSQIVSIPIHIPLFHTVTSVNNYILWITKEYPILQGEMVIRHVQHLAFKPNSDRSRCIVEDVFYHESKKILDFLTYPRSTFSVTINPMHISLSFFGDAIEYQRTLNIFR